MTVTTWEPLIDVYNCEYARMSQKSVLMLRTMSEGKKVYSIMWMPWSHRCKWKLVVTLTFRPLFPRVSSLTHVTHWLEGSVGIRPSVEVLEKRKITFALTGTEPQFMRCPAYGVVRAWIYYFALQGDSRGPLLFQIKMATTLNFVLCLLVICLAANWATLLLAPESQFTWIRSRRTPVLWLLDLHQFKIMNCRLLHEVLLGIVSS